MNKLFLIFTFVLFTTCKQNNVEKKYSYVAPYINKDSLINLGTPKRILNQYIIIRKSENYLDKSFFIVDTKENLIFLFDKKGKFVAKSPTIDGYDKQNIKYENEALKSWSNYVNDIGFKFDSKLKKYIDTTGRNRIYSHKLVFSHMYYTKGKFFPKGIYKITSKYYDSSFIGQIDNTYNVSTLNNKKIALAIHGLYKSEFRIKNMNHQINLIGNNFKEMNVPKKYIKEILNNDCNGTYNNSFGCINVPEEFLKLSDNYAVNSLIFIMGENDEDYLIN